MALNEQISRCIDEGGPIGIVCSYPVFKHLTREFVERRFRFVWINEAKPEKVMAMNLKHVVYEQAPASDRCLAICCRRVQRLNGRIHVPPHVNDSAYPDGIKNRMENY